MTDQNSVTAVDTLETERMFLIATDHHTGLGKPYETWVPGWKVGLILSPTFHPAKGSLDALSMGMFRHTTTGEQSKWYVKAGPFTRAELEEGYSTGSLNGKPFPSVNRQLPSLGRRPPRLS